MTFIQFEIPELQKMAKQNKARMAGRVIFFMVFDLLRRQGNGTVIGNGASHHREINRNRLISRKGPLPLHDPISQDAVVLLRGADNPAALGFFAFLQSADAQAILQRLGFQT